MEPTSEKNAAPAAEGDTTLPGSSLIREDGIAHRKAGAPFVQDCDMHDKPKPMWNRKQKPKEVSKTDGKETRWSIKCWFSSKWTKKEKKDVTSRVVRRGVQHRKAGAPFVQDCDMHDEPKPMWNRKQKSKEVSTTDGKETKRSIRYWFSSKWTKKKTATKPVDDVLSDEDPR